MGGYKKILFALVAVAGVAATLWLTSRAVTPKQATWADVEAEAGAGGYALISTDDLAKLYHDPRTRPLLIDVRQDWEFRAGHMAGAVNFPLEPTAWSRWRKATDLQAVLGEDRERPIVFY